MELVGREDSLERQRARAFKRADLVDATRDRVAGGEGKVMRLVGLGGIRRDVVLDSIGRAATACVPVAGGDQAPFVGG